MNDNYDAFLEEEGVYDSINRFEDMQLLLFILFEDSLILHCHNFNNIASADNNESPISTLCNSKIVWVLKVIEAYWGSFHFM